MIILEQSARSLKTFVGNTGLHEFTQTMVMRMVLAFLMHCGRISCSSAAGMIASAPVHRSQATRFLARPRWQSTNFNDILRNALLEIVPGNPERVYEGEKGNRPKLRSRLNDWAGLSLKTIRLRASTGKYADYRRLSRWRVGPKMKARAYYAYQEKCDVRSVGRVQLIFSTMKPELEKATPDDVKILMTNATAMSVSEVIELYTLRWQIELFFKELKSTLHAGHYQFEQFEAAEGFPRRPVDGNANK